MAIGTEFDQAIDTAFDRWTLLSLAVEQAWGGRDSRSKGSLLKAEVLDYLATGSRRRRPPTHENRDDVEALANFIRLRLDELFNVEVDDGSDEEVASLCLRLFTTCRAGDPSFAKEFLAGIPATRLDLSRCSGMDVTEYATDQDRLLAEAAGSDTESEGDAGGDGGNLPLAAVACMPMEPVPEAKEAPGEDQETHEAAKPASRKTLVLEPVVDEDGFTAVVKGRRRPH